MLHTNVLVLGATSRRPGRSLRLLDTLWLRSRFSWVSSVVDLDSLTPRELLEETDRVLNENRIPAANREAIETARRGLVAVELATIDPTDTRLNQLRELFRAATTLASNSKIEPKPAATNNAESEPNGKAETTAEPKPNPKPAAPPRPTTPKMTYFFVVLSLFFMYVVASLTIVYNKGVTLLGDVEALVARQPDRRFGQLERQLFVAKNQLFARDHQEESSGVDCTAGQAGCSTPSEVDDLAQESAYILMHELRDLDMQIALIDARLSEFQYEAWAPLVGMETAWVWIASLSPQVGAASADASRPTDTSGGTNGAKNIAGNSLGQITNAGCGRMQQDGAESTNPGGNLVPPRRPSTVLGMNMSEILQQACDLNIRFTSMSIPSVSEWTFRLRNLTSSYSLWILPCLYATLGSVIFFMRGILDPANPNPPLHRVVHRLALAALAGVAIGWLWEPALGSATSFNAIGAGLFTLAFIVGFSIDVFFQLLDRLVKLSTGAIDRLGGSPAP